MSNIKKSEANIFKELEELCTSSGYIHAIAYLCFRDNMLIMSGEEITVDDILNQYSDERLIRTEISTLLGLILKKDIDYTIPSPKSLQVYIDKTDTLLKELHKAMYEPAQDIFLDILKNKKDENPFIRGEFLKEAIFYSAESAYDFQYLDLFTKKYSKDIQWIKENKGFELENIRLIIDTIIDLQLEKANKLRNTFIKVDPSEWTSLEIFQFKINDICNKTSLSEEGVINVLESFTSYTNNKEFVELGDYNIINSHPILKKDIDTYILFQNYSFLEAIYESPYYWFLGDSSYTDKANEHRGDFTEELSEEIFSNIFGKKNVYKNINIYENKKRVGEIDVLVTFANRAIILQAKSKKLTLGARKGNDKLIASDFKKAIQDSYDQGYDCAKFIQNSKYELLDSSDNKITLRSDFKEIYLICIVSEHYPSLAFQTQEFLKFEETNVIKPPFVMDIFLLDVMAEMLNNPLYFLSYINKRTTQFKKFMAQSELSILSYHLKRNLYLENDISMMMIEDDVSSDLDLAMLVRRKAFPGKDTPDGILTKFHGTIIGNFLEKIKQYENDYAVEIGFFLLTLSEESIIQLNNGIQRAIDLYQLDKKGHDFTIGFDNASAGLTIHINTLDYDIAFESLLDHCKLRKYKQKANNWFGLCIDPNNKQFKFGVMSNKEWSYSKDMGGYVVQQVRKSKTKIERNEKCPCGSGKKYKKCCINIK